MADLAKGQTDQTLAALGGELGKSVTSLAQSFSADQALKGQLESAVQSLAEGKSPETVATLQKVMAAKLTPEQTKLAKETFGIASAYVVQKDLGNLEGAQGDVAQIVNSLRKGEVATALPSVQKVLSNAKLTSQQKNLLSDLAARFATGSDKAAGVQQALKGLNDLTKPAAPAKP